MSKIDLLLEYNKETGNSIHLMDVDDVEEISGEPTDFIRFMDFLIEKIENQNNVLEMLNTDHRGFEGCGCGCNEMEENYE